MCADAHECVRKLCTIIRRGIVIVACWTSSEQNSGETDDYSRLESFRCERTAERVRSQFLIFPFSSRRHFVYSRLLLFLFLPLDCRNLNGISQLRTSHSHSGARKYALGSVNRFTFSRIRSLLRKCENNENTFRRNRKSGRGYETSGENYCDIDFIQVICRCANDRFYLSLALRRYAVNNKQIKFAFLGFRFAYENFFWSVW